MAIFVISREFHSPQLLKLLIKNFDSNKKIWVSYIAFQIAFRSSHTHTHRRKTKSLKLACLKAFPLFLDTRHCVVLSMTKLSLTSQWAGQSIHDLTSPVLREAWLQPPAAILPFAQQCLLVSFPAPPQPWHEGRTQHTVNERQPIGDARMVAWREDTDG